MSTIVRDGNSINAGTKLSHANFDENIIFDTKLHTLDEVRALPVKTNESYTTLGAFADIEKKPRLDNEIVRINGQNCISVGIKAASNGNVITISKKCREIIDKKSFVKGTYQYLYDKGDTLEKLIKNTFLAALASFISIIIIIPFFFCSIKTIWLSIVFLLINTLWVIGFLRIFGFTLDQNTLSGITIALGLIADSMFVISETSESSTSFDSFIDNLKRIIPSIISASMTTLIVLIPMIFLDEIVPGVKNISITIILMIIVSLVVSIIFFPCFIFEPTEKKCSFLPQVFFKKINSFFRRKAIQIPVFSVRHFRGTSLAYVVLMIVPFFVFFVMGKDFIFPENNDVVFCSVEFEPEYSAYYINESITEFVEKIKENDLVTFVRSEAKKGNAQIEVGFNGKKTQKNQVVSFIKMMEKYVPNGFVYIPGSKKKNAKSHILEIAVVGDDSDLCREYARQASDILGKSGEWDSVVLNFKRPEMGYELVPSKESMNRNAITTQQLASSLRWMLFGPVADKWIEDGKEYDIRIRGKNLQMATRSELENLYIPVKDSSIRVSTLGELNIKQGKGKIYRKDQKRCAYLTVESTSGSADKLIKKIRTSLGEIPLKNGYGFSFSHELEKLKEQYITVVITLILSFVGIIILLSVLTEKIKKSLIIASIIPVSFVLPMCVRLVLQTPLQIGDVIGMVLLSGIGVNNSIYMVLDNRFQPIFKFRNKFSSIMVTSLTSIASAVPLLFIKGESFSKSLSFFMIWGVLDTIMVCLFLYPGFLAALDKKSELR